MKCCGQKINRYLSTLTLPTQKLFFFEKNMFLFSCSFFTPQSLEKMEKCQLLADDWDMPERSTAICGCGFVAREHPRRLFAPTPGNSFDE